MTVTMTPEKERLANVMIYVIGILTDLKDEGMASGGYEMSEAGYEQYRQLRESGFEPTPEELKSMTAFVIRSAGTEEAREVLGG